MHSGDSTTFGTRAPLHYFRIHKSTVSDNGDSGGGSRLVEEAIRECEALLIKRNLQQEQQEQAAFVHDVDQLVRALLALLQRLDTASPAPEPGRGDWNGFEEEEEDSPFQSVNALHTFCSDHRGVLLLCIDSLRNIRAQMGVRGNTGDNDANRNDKNGKKCRCWCWCSCSRASRAEWKRASPKVKSRLNALVCMLDLSVQFAEQKQCLDDAVHSNWGSSNNPFDTWTRQISYCNPLPTEVQEELLRHLGTRYTPSARQFLQTMVHVTACHGRMTRSFGSSQDSLLNWSPTLRLAMFCAMLPVFMLQGYMMPSASSRECVRFFEEITPSSGKNLWQLLDTGFINLFHRMSLTGQHIERSLLFKAPLQCLATTGLEPGDVETAAAAACQDVRHPTTSEGEIKDAIQDLGHTATPSIPTPTNSSTVQEKRPDGSVDMARFQVCYDAVVRYLQQVSCEQKEPIVQMRLISPFAAQGDTQNRSASLQLTDDSPVLNWISRTLHSVCTMRSPVATITSAAEVDASDCLIFHIHGGGFISMSSNTHEGYLREWANQCRVPIVSVDYTLAPEQMFPHQVAECFAAYRWCVQNYQELLMVNTKTVDEETGGVRPLRKVIIAGDSAGGNLAMAVALMAIHSGVRIPDAAVLCYPSTFRSHVMSPSRLLSYVDPMVNVGFHRAVDSSYFGAHTSDNPPCSSSALTDPSTDPLLSPGIAPKELLQHFPPTYFTVASMDPLFDETIYAARRVARCNGGQVAVDVYDGLFHGYISVQDSVADGKRANENIMRWMRTALE